MKAEINDLIERLKLNKHPEGGYYSELYRSEISIKELERDLMTSIYFLLTDKEVSRFHRIKSDELWFFHQGDPLIIHTLGVNGHEQFILGNDFPKGESPFHVIKGGTIFGSSLQTKEGYALVSCVVAPGFDFRDFELFDRQELIEKYPGHNDIIVELT